MREIPFFEALQLLRFCNTPDVTGTSFDAAPRVLRESRPTANDYSDFSNQRFATVIQKETIVTSAYEFPSAAPGRAIFGKPFKRRFGGNLVNDTLDTAANGTGQGAG